MVGTGAGPKNIFRQIYKIQLAYVHHQAHEYFRLIGIINIGSNVLPDPLLVSDLLNLAGSEQEIQNFYDKVHSDMIAKEIDV